MPHEPHGSRTHQHTQSTTAIDEPGPGIRQATGLSYPAIAARLTLASRTVENHVAAIFRKLRVQTRDHAIAQARRLGITPPEAEREPRG